MTEDNQSVGLAGTIEDTVARVVGDVSPDQDGPAALDQALVADLGYNSLLLIELAFSLEELFGLDQMTVEDAPPIGTVRDLVDYVRERVDAGRATVPDADVVEEYLQMR